MVAEPRGSDWPLRCEMSRLEARVGHLTERVAQDVARLSSLRASRATVKPLLSSSLGYVTISIRASAMTRP